MQNNFVSILLCFTAKQNESTCDNLNLHLIGSAFEVKEIINESCRILQKYSLLVVSELETQGLIPACALTEC